jgi:hypothetical protein
MTPAEWKARVAELQKAREKRGGDYFIVDIYNDPESSRLDDEDRFQWPTLMGQPDAETLQRYREHEEERLRRQAQRPPTRLIIKRSPREAD